MKPSSHSWRNNNIAPNDRILRMSAFCKMLGLSRSQTYALIARGDLPQGIPLTPEGKVKGWLHSWALEYIQSRIEASHKNVASG